MAEKLAVVWPLGKQAEKPRKLAPRLDTLAGKTIGGLYNGHFQFEVTFEQLEKLLSARYPGMKFVSWEKFGTFADVTEKALCDELPAKLKQYKVDAVISGTGC